LGFHFNPSLTALNLLRLEDRQQAVEGAGRNVISIASWKTRKFNAHLLERFSCHLGIDFTAIKSRRLSENTNENLAARITPPPIFMAQP
jgi:hypothetical protein